MPHLSKITFLNELYIQKNVDTFLKLTEKKINKYNRKTAILLHLNEVWRTIIILIEFCTAMKLQLRYESAEKPLDRSYQFILLI